MLTPDEARGLEDAMSAAFLAAGELEGGFGLYIGRLEIAVRSLISSETAAQVAHFLATGDDFTAIALAAARATRAS